MDNFYGNLNFSTLETEIDFYVEEINLRGYCIINSLISPDEISKVKNSIYNIYELQKTNFGEERLEKINDKDMVRCLLKYDFSIFKALAFNPIILKLVNALIKQKFILGLQNAIINRTIDHHQGSWHRDLPYQNFVCNEILSVNALWAMNDFSVQNGGTCLLPYSMNFHNMPSKKFSEENLVQPEVSAGSVIVFNSMLLHRAGANKSKQERIAVNHQYIRPFIQPQYCFSEMEEIAQQTLSNNELDILGFNFNSSRDDIDWRNARYKKTLGNSHD